MIAFGPIPSRRLGRSLGINNIPPKTCSYSCAYCQVGRTLTMQLERQKFFQPLQIFREVQEKLRKLRRQGEPPDYLSFVPDGEPTLDIRLGREIELLRFLNIKIAVFTNASLIWRADVREELAKADWVSLKLDSFRENTWRKVDRPHRLLRLSEIQYGMQEFAKNYHGVLTTETMLVKDSNDIHEQAEVLADFLAQLKPSKAYISIPTRPPAESWVRPPEENALNDFYQTFKKKIKNVEYLIGYEGNAFAHTGSIENDILDITAVHPMREEAVNELLYKAGKDWSPIQALLEQNLLLETEYEGKKFYMRRFNRKKNKPKLDPVYKSR